MRDMFGVEVRTGDAVILPNSAHLRVVIVARIQYNRQGKPRAFTAAWPHNNRKGYKTRSVSAHKGFMKADWELVFRREEEYDALVALSERFMRD